MGAKKVQSPNRAAQLTLQRRLWMSEIINIQPHTFAHHQLSDKSFKVHDRLRKTSDSEAVTSWKVPVHLVECHFQGMGNTGCEYMGELKGSLHPLSQKLKTTSSNHLCRIGLASGSQRNEGFFRLRSLIDLPQYPCYGIIGWEQLQEKIEREPKEYNVMKTK